MGIFRSSRDNDIAAGESLMMIISPVFGKVSFGILIHLWLDAGPYIGMASLQS